MYLLGLVKAVEPKSSEVSFYTCFKICARTLSWAVGRECTITTCTGSLPPRAGLRCVGRVCARGARVGRANGLRKELVFLFFRELTNAF
jgi:hypothetical protein